MRFLCFTLGAAALLGLPLRAGAQEAPAAPAPSPRPQLRIISDFQTEPFSFSEGLKHLGFEVELAEALGAELGAEVVWVKQMFNLPTFSSTLETNGADMAMAAITVTPAREEQFLFSRPYFRSALAAATLRDVDWDHLKWKNGLSHLVPLGVQRRTTAEEWAKKNLKATRKTYDNPSRLARALNNNDVAVILMDEEILVAELSRLKYKFKLVEKGFDEQDYAIAFARGNEALRDRVDAALEKLDADGVYDRLYEKWFGRLADLPKRLRPSRGQIGAK